MLQNPRLQNRRLWNRRLQNRRLRNQRLHIQNLENSKFKMWNMVRLRQACRRGALVASSSRIWTNLSPEDNDRKCRAPGQVLENIIMVSGVYKLRASCWGATNHTTYIQQWKGYDYDCQTSFSHERDPWKWRHVTRKAYCCCPLSYTRKG